MFDETQNKIIHATMNLIMERGYSATTTKDIAQYAGVNECTIFRKFKGKKEIVLSAMQLPEWNPNLSETDFSCCGKLEADLTSFSEVYMNKVTPSMVKLSIGLRTPELYQYTSEEILKVPMVFKTVLIKYFIEMRKKYEISFDNPESIAMTFLSMNFGFVFLEASFGKRLTELEKKKYISESINIFVKGIKRKEN